MGWTGLVRGKADKGLLVEYMGVQVIIAARMAGPRDKGVWVLVSANTPRDVEVSLEDWEPDMVVLPLSELAMANAIEDAGGGSAL